MIELKNFSIGYRHRPLLEKVTAVFPGSSLTALLGRNGSGKSTLLRAFAGLNTQYGGAIMINGKSPRELTSAELAREIALVTTERIRVASLRCEDVVAMGRAVYTNWMGNLQEADREIVAESLQAVGMELYALRTMDTMSDGECQRIMIARALAQDTRVIILDEPTSFLDLPNRYELCSLLGRLARDKGKTIVFSTHELDLALEMSHSIALIDSGTLTVCETPEVRASGCIQAHFQLNRWK